MRSTTSSRSSTRPVASSRGSSLRAAARTAASGMPSPLRGSTTGARCRPPCRRRARRGRSAACIRSSMRSGSASIASAAVASRSASRSRRPVRSARSWSFARCGASSGVCTTDEARLFERVREIAQLLVELGDLQVPADALLRGPNRLETDEEHPREVRVAPGRAVVIPQPRRRALAHRPARAVRRLRLAPLRSRRRLASRRHRRASGLRRGRRRSEDALEQRPDVRPHRGCGPVRRLEERFDRVERGGGLSELVEQERGHAGPGAPRLLGP